MPIPEKTKKEILNSVKKVDAKVKEQLIEEHGKNKLRILEIPKDELGLELLEVIVKIPTRNVINQFMKFIDQNPKKAQEVLANGCLLTCKEEVNADDALFLSCISGLTALFPIREAVIKNL